MNKVEILTDSPLTTSSILDGIKGYSFKFIKSLKYSSDDVDLYIIDSTFDRTMINQIPYNVRSFYFPIHRLSDEKIYSCLDAFYSSLAKDQTVFTKRYNFVDETLLPTEYGDFIMFGFRGRTNGKTILGLRTLEVPKIPSIRTHSMCYTGDIFHSLRCDCREELENALRYIQENGGIFIYALEEGRGIGVLNKITVYNSQHAGYDTVDAQYINGHPNDLRDYDYLKDILEHYAITSAKLITNNPMKALSIEMAGVQLVDCIKLRSKVNNYNRNYLLTKMKKNKHNFVEELGLIA